MADSPTKHNVANQQIRSSKDVIRLFNVAVADFGIISSVICGECIKLELCSRVRVTANAITVGMRIFDLILC